MYGAADDEQTPLVSASRQPNGVAKKPPKTGLQVQAQERRKEVHLVAYATEEGIAREQHQEAAKVAEDVQVVKDLFQENRNIIVQGQPALDQTEGNVDQAGQHVEKGRQELSKANEHQKASRKRMCMLVFLLVVVIAVVVIVIIVTKK